MGRERVEDSGREIADHSPSLMPMRACTGLTHIMPTIMMGNREMVLPAIHMMNRLRGSCFHGPSATDQPI